MKILYFICTILILMLVPIIIAARRQVPIKYYMDGPVQLCKNFNEKNTILDFSKLEFIQLDDDEVVLNGTVHINAEINAPLAFEIQTKKFERGIWINSFMNQYIFDLCREIENPAAPNWINILKHLATNGKCPMLPDTYEYNNFKIETNINVGFMLPSKIFGKWRGDIKFLKVNKNGADTIISCATVYLEIAQH